MTSLPSEPRLAPVSPDIVWFSGTDALRFLNDLISQEIGDMSAGEARRSFLLGPQGKLEFLLWVLADTDRIGLVTDSGRGDELESALSRYRIRVDVEISPEEGGIWLVVGDWDGWDLSWGSVARNLVIGERPDLDVMDVDIYESLRIGAGEPAWDVDVDEKTIPHESGLVPVSVDFTKGCFLGQELVARIDSRGGNVPRRLVLLESDDVLEAGIDLVKNDKPVGRVTSAAGRSGLGVVHRDVDTGDALVAAGIRTVVRDLPEKTHG